ncbi:MAG: protein kinase [Myxococcota bacterium]
MSTGLRDEARIEPRRGPSVATQHDLAELNMRHRLRSSLFGESAPPVKVDRYVVLEPLGEGGLGVVYAAYDPKLDRRVALKLINPALITPNAAQRMQREAQAMAQIRHPNVAVVHDTGTHGEGTFIAMELVEGATLLPWVRARARGWKPIRDVLVAAGKGLAAAHHQGLVHRDFKPTNVIVDAHARPRVLDFGLACAADEVDALTGHRPTSLLGEALTKTGVLMGTPQYMAPEQFGGRADARSDQWAFCATAWESLYGVRPFSAADVPSLRAMIDTGAIHPPPPDSPVPGWLERILRRGLSRAPSDRFEGMDALLTAMQRDKRSRRVQIVGLGAAVVLSAALTGTAMWLTRPEPTAESRARVQQLEQDARAAAAEGHFIYPPAQQPNAPTAYARVIALEQVEGPVADEARLRASQLREELAQRLVSLGDAYSEQAGGEAFAADYYAAALVFAPDDARARERSTLTPGQLATLRRKAETAKFSSAELQGAEVLAALAEPDEPRRTKKVAAIYRTKDRRPAASTSVLLEELLGREPMEQGSVRGLGVGSGVGRPPERPTPETAAVEGVRTIESAGTDPDTTDPDTTNDSARSASSSDRADGPSSSGSSQRDAATEARAGRAARARGDDRTAEKAFHRALNKDRRNLAALLGLSELYFDRGAYQKSLGYARKAIGVAPRSGDAHMQLGDACFKVHRYDEARRAYAKAVQLGHGGAQRALKRLEQRIGD